MAKILFINPVIREEDAPRHIPYGQALMAAIAIKGGHQVQIFDANAWRPTDEELREALEADAWDIIATGGITTAYSYIKKTIGMAGKYAPHSLTVAGGGFLTSMPHDIMTFLPDLYIGVIGEGFITWPEILRQVDQGKTDWSTINGIIYRDASGNCQVTPPRTLIQDLDVIPYPAWEYYPLDIYFRNSCLLLSEEAMQAKRRLDVNASYGCSLICRFCFHLGLTGDMDYVEESGKTDVSFTHKRTIRWHSPRYIVDLVKHAKKSFNIDFVAFLDENLMTMNKST